MTNSITTDKNWKTKAFSEYLKSERIRDERLQSRRLRDIMGKLRRALNIEVERGELSDSIRKKLIMSPIEYMEKTWVKISVVNLYRRYRRIRIQALTECIAIASRSDKRDDTVEEIRKLIVETGSAHKASKERADKCAVS